MYRKIENSKGTQYSNINEINREYARTSIIECILANEIKSLNKTAFTECKVVRTWTNDSIYYTSSEDKIENNYYIICELEDTYYTIFVNNRHMLSRINDILFKYGIKIHEDLTDNITGYRHKYYCTPTEYKNIEMGRASLGTLYGFLMLLNWLAFILFLYCSDYCPPTLFELFTSSAVIVGVYYKLVYPLAWSSFQKHVVNRLSRKVYATEEIQEYEV
jgi:hypothetical protein